MKKIEPSEHFTCKKLLVYSLPIIGEMAALSSFGAVDGLFVANFLGSEIFAAVDMVSVVFTIIFALGFMFGSGGNALVSQFLGEGKKKEANEVFTMSLMVIFLISIPVAALCIWKMPFLAALAGARGEMSASAVSYGRMIMIGVPLFMFNAALDSLWITADKGWVGFAAAIAGGILNIALDWIFLGPLHMGVRGAALSSVIAQGIAVIFSFLFFIRSATSNIHFVPIHSGTFKYLGQVCFNGASETVSNLSVSLTGLIAYRQTMRYQGTTGAAAIGVFFSVVALTTALSTGVASAVVTIAGYKYGQKDKKELKSLMKTNTVLMIASGTVICILCILFSGVLSWIYFRNEPEAYALTGRVLRITATSSIFSGFNMVTISFFTGMGDGLSSIILAAVDSFIAPAAMLFILPVVFGPGAIYYSLTAAAVLTAILCVVFLRYHLPIDNIGSP